MTDLYPFDVSTVVAEPHNDKPRLELAQDLEAKNAPYGRFIRLQVSLSAANDANERSQIQKALMEIEPDEAWSSPMKELGFKHPKYRPGWRFERGFVGHVTTTAKTLLAKGDALFTKVPITSLLLLKANDEELDALAEKRWLRQVVRLGIIIRPATAPTALFNSPHLSSVRHLEMNWEAADPSNFPKDLGPKPVQALINSPLLSHLTTLKLSVSSVKTLLELLSSAGLAGVKHLGVARQGGFSQRDIEKLSDALALEHLEELEFPNFITPRHAPLLKRVKVESISLLEMSPLLFQLEELKAARIWDKSLRMFTEETTPTSLRNLTFFIDSQTANPDELIGGLTRSTALQNLEKLNTWSMWTGITARTVEALIGDAFPNLSSLSFRCATSEDLAPLAGVRHSHLSELSVGWKKSTGGLEVFSDLPARLVALEVAGPYASNGGDQIIEQLSKGAGMRLHRFAMSKELNQPSFGEAGARYLLDGSGVPSLACIWARLHGLPSSLLSQLRQRLAVHDGGIDHGSPFSDNCNWNWQEGHWW
jgi:hypothetical protein